MVQVLQERYNSSSRHQIRRIGLTMRRPAVSTEYILACDRIRNLAVANYSYWKQDYGKKYKAVDTFGSSLKLLELYPRLDIAPSSVHYVRIFDSLYHSLKGDIKGLRFRIFLQKIRRIKASRAYPLVHMSENKLRRIFCIL